MKLNDKESYEDHIKSHNSGDYKCTISKCNKTFKSLSSRSIHMLKVHKLHYCMKCEKEIDENDWLVHK